MTKPKADQTRKKMTKKGKGKAELTIKQQRFIDSFDGNIKTAAKYAGLSYDYCRRMVTKSHIVAAIKDRENQRKGNKIASREERQKFWTDMMKDSEKDSDKLKASELLGRSEADFTDNLKVEEVKPLVIFDEDEDEDE